MKFLGSAFLALTTLFLTVFLRPAYAQENLPKTLAISSDSTELVQASSYARILCTKSEDICIRSIEQISQEKKPPKSSPTPSFTTPTQAFPVKIVTSTSVVFPHPRQDEPVTSLDPNKIFDLVNGYRAQLGLTPFQKEDNLCLLANARKAEIQAEVANGSMHSGLYARRLPYWITENMIYVNSEEQALSWWISSPVHRHSMTGDYTFSCVCCEGKVCAQLFTSFVPKAAPTPTVVISPLPNLALN